MYKKISKSTLLLCVSSFVLSTTFGQLANTRWKTTLQIGGPVNSIIEFRKDTVSVYTTADSTIIESMTYKKNDTLLTLRKIEGQSDCDNSTIGNYGYRIKGDSLLLKLLKDECDDRSSVIENTIWTKLKIYPGIKVDEAILKQYTGVYAVDEAHLITISLENGILYAEGPNNGLPKSPFIPVTTTKFFLKVAAVEMDFIKDEKGNIVKLISHEAKDYELKKIK
jgi:hypothetical protein